MKYGYFRYGEGKYGETDSLDSGSYVVEVPYAGENQVFPTPISLASFGNNIISIESFATFTDAIESIGSQECTLLIDTQTVVDRPTLVNRNISIVILKPGLINCIADLTINCDFNAGLYQVFTGDGSVNFGSSSISSIYPQWWGAKGDGITIDTAAMQKWFAAICVGGRKGFLPPGRYLTDTLSTDLSRNPWSVTIEGVSPTGSQIKLIGGSNGDLLSINVGQPSPSIWPTYWTLRNVLLDGNSSNNSSGSVLNLFQCNLFLLDNVILQNGAEWNLKLDSCIGLYQRGKTIWGNTLDGTKGLGSIYIKNSSDVDIDVALQSFSESDQVPLFIERTSGFTNIINANIRAYLEANKNGIKVVDLESSIGMDISIFPTQLVGLSSSGGVLFDVTGNSQTKVTVTGGNVLNSWDAGYFKTSGSPTLKFIDVSNVSNLSNFQDDRSGVITEWGASERANLVPNGDFEIIGPIFEAPWAGNGMAVRIGDGGIYSLDTINKRSGSFGWKYDNTSASETSETDYWLQPSEVRQSLGKILNSTIWVKGDAANASDLYIFIEAASLPGGDKTYISSANHDAEWENLRVAAPIPEDATYIRVVSRVYSSHIATVDNWMISLNYSGPYISKEVSNLVVKVLRGVQAPDVGTWDVGDRVINSVPEIGQPKAWVCTVAGTPGTWVSEGNL